MITAETKNVKPQGSIPWKVGGADFNRVCKDHNIKVHPFSDPKIAGIMEGLNLSKDSSGYSIVAKDCIAILYDDGRSERDIRFTLAHELGHILLGHLDYRKGVLPGFAEREADSFACALIANDIFCRYRATT